MATIHLFAVLGIFLPFCLARFAGTDKYTNRKMQFIFLLLAGIFLRILLACTNKGFSSDLACFSYWADRIFEVGPGSFYSPDIFTDYPPGYILILYPVGALKSMLGLTYQSPLHLLLLKLPALIADVILAILLYKICTEKENTPLSVWLLGLILFSPFLLVNSAMWGQVDAVLTAFAVGMVYAMQKGKMYPAYFLFALGLLIKPQMLFFAPVLFSGFLDQVIFHRFKPQKLAKHLAVFFLALCTDLLLILPFGLKTVVNQYITTIKSYPYAAVNAANLWGMLGLNWSAITPLVRIVGTLGILSALVLVLYLGFIWKNTPGKYYLQGALMLSILYCFSSNMHDRYLYPALVMLLFALFYFPYRELMAAFTCWSVCHLFNTAYVLFFYDPGNYNAKAAIWRISSLGILIGTGLLVYAALRIKGKALHRLTAAAKVSGNVILFRSEPACKLVRLDYLILLAIILVYSFFAFRDLGDTAAPENGTALSAETYYDLYFEEGTPAPAALSYYYGPPNGPDISVGVFDESGAVLVNYAYLDMNSVFTWKKLDLMNIEATLDSDTVNAEGILTETVVVRFLSFSESNLIYELVFTDQNGRTILPSNSLEYPVLFDEQDLYNEEFSFRNSMYFDEIYHARTAYEYINGLQTYETTHPPLGKELIALGIRIFGMNPFGWRIIGTLFGILMLPAIYVFAKRLTKDTALAALACVLLAFDFMHFTQSRIATIDVYITFFVILMYFFMYEYTSLSFYDTSLRKTFLPLGLCGLCMGLGIASKWTGIYAGMGLALLFFATLVVRKREYNAVFRTTSDRKKSKKPKKLVPSDFHGKTGRTILFCIVFFVAVPAFIYLLSYLPVKDGTGNGLLTRLIDSQKYMFRYHSNLVSEHPYASRWYEWPIIKKPVWYYSRVLSGAWNEGGFREGISAFGNPLVWWVGILASLNMLRLALFKKDRNAIFLLVGYCAQYLPWSLISRDTFMYHYFPSVPFIVLMIVYSLTALKSRLSRKDFLLILVVYGLATFVLFIVFYPVLSGQPVDSAYVAKYLRWFDSWVLTVK